MQHLTKQQTDIELSRLERELQLLMFHVDTLKPLLKAKEDKIYSNIVDQDGNKAVSPASLTDEGRLNIRYDYYQLAREALDLEREIESKKEFLKNYKEHVARTAENQTKQISDKAFNELISKIEDLKLSGKEKSTFIEMKNTWVNGNIAGLENRNTFYQALGNFYKQNS